uniref:Gasdermin pore forming domain-containing protein n=1 Tax=Bos indicus x Bos taurus TaxID=30522 RepID=A0A4W2DT96_BOBOX
MLKTEGASVPILYSPKTQWPGTVQRPYTEGILTTSIFVGPGTMPTVFESISRAVVKEIDTSGETIAVRSLSDADKFHCSYLVKKRRRFFGYQYDKTNLTLKDILECEVPFDMVVPELQGQGDNFEILDVVDSKGSLAVKFHPQMTFKIAFHIFQEKNIKLEKSEIPQEFLDSLKNKKLKKELPPSFQSIQAKREDLYLVTETLKTKRTETLKYETQFGFQILLKMFGFQCKHKHQKEVTITPEKVLAYRVKQLVFPSAERMDICFLDKTRSFPEEKDGGSSWLGKSLNLENFRSIKERVQDMVRVLQDLTPEEQKEALNCFTKCLSSEEELQDLEQRVSEVQCSGELQMNSPANSLISSLFNAAGALIEARAETIWDVLDALMELSEYRQFVAEVLDKGELRPVKDKVESILEENRCEGPLDVSCDPEARTLCALYVVVSILLQLSEKPTSVSS